MTTMQHFAMTDLGRQKRLEVDFFDDPGGLTPDHSVGQAIEHFLDRKQIPETGLRWTAASRGVLLDSKRLIRELDPADQELTVLPEVSAGNGG